MLVCVLQVHDVRICRLIISQCAVVTCAMMKTASTVMVIFNWHYWYTCMYIYIM